MEAYDGDGSDSCGIHGTGSGFERVDTIESWAPAAFEEAIRRVPVYFSFGFFPL